MVERLNGHHKTHTHTHTDSRTHWHITQSINFIRADKASSDSLAKSNWVNSKTIRTWQWPQEDRMNLYIYIMYIYKYGYICIWIALALSTRFGFSIFIDRATNDLRPTTNAKTTIPTGTAEWKRSTIYNLCVVIVDPRMSTDCGGARRHYFWQPKHKCDSFSPQTLGKGAERERERRAAWGRRRSRWCCSWADDRHVIRPTEKCLQFEENSERQRKRETERDQIEHKELFRISHSYFIKICLVIFQKFNNIFRTCLEAFFMIFSFSSSRPSQVKTFRWNSFCTILMYLPII